MFAFVPPEIAEWAATTVPWRAEVLLYASDLADRLPEGLGMPRGLRVEEHEDETAVIWLEAVDCDPVPWGREDASARHGCWGGCGQRPGRPAGGDRHPGVAHRRFVRGGIAHTVLPGLHDDATWRHPAVAEHFGDLRAR